MIKTLNITADETKELAQQCLAILNKDTKAVKVEFSHYLTEDGTKYETVKIDNSTFAKGKNGRFNLTWNYIELLISRNGKK